MIATVERFWQLEGRHHCVARGDTNTFFRAENLRFVQLCLFRFLGFLALTHQRED